MSGPAPSDPTPPPASGEGQPSAWTQSAQQWKPAPVAEGPSAGVAYADLGIRIGAYIIDIVAVGVIALIINAILGAILVAGFLTSGFALVLVGFIILAVVNLLISAVYFIYTWTTMRASPGQKLLGLQTVSATDGATLTTNQAITRFAVMVGPGLVGALASNVIGGILGLLLSLAGLAWTIYLLYTTANDPKRQGVHDKYAGSVVVKPAA